MTDFSFVIPLPPVSKKNSQQILINPRTNRPFIMPSKKYREYETAAMKYLPKRDAPIGEPVNVRCAFYMPTRRRCDLVNLLEAVDDLLVKGGVLADDNCDIVVSHDCSRVYYDKDEPCTMVEITKAERSFAE